MERNEKESTCRIKRLIETKREKKRKISKYEDEGKNLQNLSWPSPCRQFVVRD